MGVIAYHLTGATLRDGRPLPAIGEVLRHNGPVIPCEQGLHASVRLLDAMRYAPAGACWIHRVEVGGTIVPHGGDKVAARKRTILASWPLDRRRVVRLACEAAALSAWCHGRCDDRLVLAAEAADRGDWAACRSYAYAAADAAAARAAAAAYAAYAAARAYTAYAAAAYAAYAAADAYAAARDCLEARAVELLCGP